jgi:hypothetical protein
MKLIVGKNDSGKTRELIKHSLETGIPIFALYDSKAESIKAKSIYYFNKPAHVVTADDLANGNYAGEILVDDLEKVFTVLLADFTRSSALEVAGATITED